MLTDGRKDFRCDPVFELFGIRQLAGKNQAVQARFIDDGQLLFSTGGEHFVHPFVFIINMVTNGFLWIAVPKSFCHILTDKPWFVVDFYRALCAL